MKHQLTDLDDLLYDFLKWLKENEKMIGVEEFYNERSNWELAMLQSIFHRLEEIADTEIYKSK